MGIFPWGSYQGSDPYHLTILKDVNIFVFQQVDFAPDFLAILEFQMGVRDQDMAVLIHRHLEDLVARTDAIRDLDADIVAGSRPGHLLIIDLHGIERHGQIRGMTLKFDGVTDHDLPYRNLDGGHTQFSEILHDFPDPLFSHSQSSFPTTISGETLPANDVAKKLYLF
jgi:hypothetical protein